MLLKLFICLTIGIPQMQPLSVTSATSTNSVTMKLPSYKKTGLRQKLFLHVIKQRLQRKHKTDPGNGNEKVASILGYSSMGLLVLGIGLALMTGGAPWLATAFGIMMSCAFIGSILTLILMPKRKKGAHLKESSRTAKTMAIICLSLVLLVGLIALIGSLITFDITI
ncbi:MAG: hypothetical protein U0T11_06235 [Chitinophagaceae bacterium]